MTTRIITSFALLLATFSAVVAQSFSGRIVAADTGEPLPYASIYVQETGSGTVTNENGFYRLQLKKSGSYTLVFQYLGYATEVRNVRAGGQQTLDIELNAESFNLETIEVVDGGEDVSYSVIRRAIAKADYHLNQVDSYTARVYIKGGGRVKKVSKLIMAMIPKEDRKDIDTSRVFTSESLSDITYTRPNTFKQDVISTYQVGDVPVDATPYLFASFYEPMIAEAVSPLAPRAFGYYKFEHQGLFNDRGNNVNKIKVTPRSRGEDVFSGYINIVEGSWAIHSLELEVYKFGIRFVVSQTYAPVEADVWMPVNTTVGLDGSIMGITIEGNYLSTVSDYKISLNPDLPAYVEVIDEKTNPDAAAVVRKSNKSRDFEDRLMNGGELTRKEMRQLMREYEKREKAVAEAPEVKSDYTFNQDSSKGVRDTAFWAEVRPVPLTTREVRSYAIEDSLAIVNAGVKPESNSNDSITIKIGSEGTSIRRSKRKFLRIFPNVDFFNAVEGYAAGVELSTKFKLGKKQDLKLALNPRYGFAWRKATLKGNLGYINNKKRIKVNLEGGRYLRQYDDRPALDPILGTFAMLFSHKNYLNFYEREYGTLSMKYAPKPEACYSASLTYENRHRVRNYSNEGWLNTKGNVYDANEPIVLERSLTNNSLPRLEKAAILNLGMTWRPGLEYSITNGRKNPIETSAPTIKFEYRGGFPGIGDSKSDFQHLQASYAHNFQIGIRGKVSMMVRGGAFLRNEFLQLPDYRHFVTSETILTNADPVGSYRLLPYYTYSTSDAYGEFYGHYQFRKFLLSRIWELQKRGIREDLFVNYLYTPKSDHYTELGYTIDNILRVFRLEFVTSWQNFEYRDFGVRVSIASTIGNIFKSDNSQ